MKCCIVGIIARRIGVTPLAGVWIEMLMIERNLTRRGVTPLAGVWIEMDKELLNYALENVTPFAGVWIEIPIFRKCLRCSQSLPLRECGLK